MGQKMTCLKASRADIQGENQATTDCHEQTETTFKSKATSKK
jgi:hypothetical protein